MKQTNSIKTTYKNHTFSARTLGNFFGQAVFACALFICTPLMLFAATSKIVYSGPYNTSVAAERGIWTMNADGTNRARITTGNDRQPQFSLDGRKIVFVDDTAGSITVVHADGTNRTNLFTGNVANPSFSPDGTKILFTNSYGGNRIVVMNADGTNAREIVNDNLGYGGSNDPEWSPDGTRIAYWADYDYNQNFQTPTLYVINADGTNKVRYAFNPYVKDFFPSWSPDGTKLIFVRETFNNNVTTDTITTLNLSDGTFSSLGVTADFDSRPKYSPDGTKIVFQKKIPISSNTDVIKIVTMNADGTNQTRINSSLNEAFPRFYVPTGRLAAKFDLNGDGKAEQLVFRPSSGYWFSHTATDPLNNFRAFQFGTNGDIPLAEDTDGDGKIDYSVARPAGNNYRIFVWQSSTDTLQPVEYFGSPQLGDVFVSGDFDGDGRSDRAVVRYGSTPGQNLLWIIKLSTTSREKYISDFGTGFDASGNIDTPFAADMDGDGKDDLVVRRRTGEFFVRPSAGGGDYGYPFGYNTDLPALADYDGDGKTDIAVYRPSNRTLFINRSRDGFTGYLMTDSSSTEEFGLTSVIPVSADYDGDGKADPAVFSKPNGLWLIYLTGSGQVVKNQWGLSTDLVPPGGFKGLSGAQ